MEEQEMHRLTWGLYTRSAAAVAVGCNIVLRGGQREVKLARVTFSTRPPTEFRRLDVDGERRCP